MGNEGKNFKSGWAESDYDDSLVVSEPRDFVRHRADQIFGPNSQSGLNGRGEGQGGGHVVEEIEMKRQLWLKSCRGDDNHKKTYGSAFVAPSPNPKNMLPRRSSSKLFFKSSEDTQNLLDDMI